MESRSILETIQMVAEENLDIRTITMGISLFDCVDSDGERARQKSMIRSRLARRTWSKWPLKFKKSTVFLSSISELR